MFPDDPEEEEEKEQRDNSWFLGDDFDPFGRRSGYESRWVGDPGTGVRREYVGIFHPLAPVRDIPVGRLVGNNNSAGGEGTSTSAAVAVVPTFPRADARSIAGTVGGPLFAPTRPGHLSGFKQPKNTSERIGGSVKGSGSSRY